LVPTVSELGFPDVDANVWVGLFAPSSMGAELVNKVHRDVTAILQEPAFRAREIEGKAYDFAAMGPQDFRKYIQAETASRAGPVKFSGAKVE
jgi:tripartite-type tricarboxylate transporter receptor subunit TctC